MDMNAETFTKLIRDHDQLHNVPYSELKGLVEQYPYCQNLRYLLLKKCAFEDRQDFDNNLQIAATFSNDRKLFFKNIHKKGPVEEKSSPKSFIEEKQDPEIVSDNDSEPINVEIPAAETQVETNIPTSTLDRESEINEENKVDLSTELAAVELNYYDESELENDIEDITEEIDLDYNLIGQESTSSPKTEEPEEEYENVISIEELLELDTLTDIQKPIEKSNKPFEKKTESLTKENQISDPPPKKDKPKKKPPPTPKSSFGSWVKQFQEPEPLEKPAKKRKQKKKQPKKQNHVSKKQKKKQPKKKAKKGLAIAERSLKENKEIVSETLANILASQGSYEKAIEMFEKLSLIFPKKSSYFADQIKKLKKY